MDEENELNEQIDRTVDDLDRSVMAQEIWKRISDDVPLYVLAKDGTITRATSMEEFVGFRQRNEHIIADDRAESWRVTTVFLGIPGPRKADACQFETKVWLIGDAFEEDTTDTLAEAKVQHMQQVARMRAEFGDVSKSQAKRIRVQRTHAMPDDAA